MALTPEQRELQLVQEKERALEKRLAQILDVPSQMAKERDDMENTVPAPDIIAKLGRIRKREDIYVSRCVVRNAQIAITKSLALCFLLIAAAAALVWWARTASGQWNVL